MKLKEILSNKVFLYLWTRYVTYAIQFISSIFIAVKLGPYYFGIWGMILLILNYFQVINFGIPSSLNILLVQNKKDPIVASNYIKSAMVLIGLLNCIVLLVMGIYYLFFRETSTVGGYFYLACIIAMLVYFNGLNTVVYRVKGKLGEVAFYQSVIPLLVFVTMFTTSDQKLLGIFLLVYFIGHIVSLVNFFQRRQIPFDGTASKQNCFNILNKGLFLFIYNACFYLIIISTRTTVSVFYPVEQFGFFTFAYSLANSVMLFLDTIQYIIFPKLVDKLQSEDIKEVKKTLEKLKINYIYLTHGLMYAAMLFFPLLLHFIPKYQGTLQLMNMIGITVLLLTNNVGYSILLMARNKEKLLSLISLCSLLVTIAGELLLSVVFKVNYQYIILSTLIGYYVFCYLCIYYGSKLLNEKVSFCNIAIKIFPLKLLLPYVSAFLIAIFKFDYLFWIPFIFFVMLNIGTTKEWVPTLRAIMHNSQFINITQD